MINDSRKNQEEYTEIVNKVGLIFKRIRFNHYLFILSVVKTNYGRT